MDRAIVVAFLFAFIALTSANIETESEELQELKSREDEHENEAQTWDGNLNVFEKDQPSSKWTPSGNYVKKEGRKKIKIKKKDKKMLMEILTAGLLVKSAFLPLAVGFLKLLTGKALMITMMALTLILAITFKSATEKKQNTTEVINLTGHGHRHRSLEVSPEIIPVLFGDFSKKFKR